MKFVEFTGCLEIVLGGSLGVTSDSKEVSSSEQEANLELCTAMLALLCPTPCGLGSRQVFIVSRLVSLQQIQSGMKGFVS